MIQIGIIGGGASGLTAAIAAKRVNKSAEVFILEHKDVLGKKILSTGNGRCNLTNEVMDKNCFRSEQIHIVEEIVGRFDTRQTFSFFASMGVLLKSRNGYVYPRNGQAISVVEALKTEVNMLDIKVYKNTHVSAITKADEGFYINCEDRTFFAHKVILATGGKAAPVLGADGSGYALAESMGHSLIATVPALVQLRAKHNPLANAAGVRTDATVTAIVNGRNISSDTGELQVTAYGISGIPVFQISRYISKAIHEKKMAQVIIDFIPEMNESKWGEFLTYRAKKNGHLNMVQFLESIFPQKLVVVLLKLAGLSKSALVSEVNVSQLSSFAKQCKHLIVDITETNGFENAQVCAGGVSLAELNPKTMESCYNKGLYMIGELLDADGICGGYNLHWAWSTGYLAGRAAADKE